MKTINRRKFIKQSGLLSTGVILSTSCSAKSIEANNRKLGVALVGLGYYSKDLLAPALQLTEHCELRGIVTGTPSKIPVWQEKYGIKDSNVYNYDNMHQIADNDDIDVIYIVVPTALHMKYAVAAAETGKHVWCEKPMAMTVDQCERIIASCKSNRVKLSIGYRMQHEMNTIKVIENAKTLPFGQIESIRSIAGYAGGGGSGWRFEKAMGGGALYDMGVYTVNAIRYSTNMMPVTVKSAQRIIDRPALFKEVDETTEYTLQFENGMEAYGMASVGRNQNILRVNCEKGWYELSPMQAYSGVAGKVSDGTIWPASPKNQQATQMDNDALAIMNDTDVIAPGESALPDIRIIEAIIKSADTGVSVTI